MRQYFDPFENCNGPANTTAPKAFSSVPTVSWVMEAVQVIVGLAYAFDTLKNGGSNVDKLLNDIGDKLDEIKSELADLNRNIDRVIDLLIDMPRVVRGEVEGVILKSNLGEIHNIAGLIKDLVKGTHIIQESVRLQAHLDLLSFKLGSITGLKGVSGSLLASPYVAVWLSASVALQKALKREKAAHNVISPWDSSFMKDMGKLYADMFIQAEALDFEFDKGTIPRMPKHNVPLMVENGHFRSALPTEVGRYRLVCPWGGGKELECLVRGISPDPVWKPVKSGDSAHQEAISSFEALKIDRNVIGSFYAWLPKLYEKKLDLREVFIEPANYW